MKILVIGEPQNLEECKDKFGNLHEYLVDDQQETGVRMSSFDVVFDFSIEEDPFRIETYADLESAIVFLNTAKISLLDLSVLVNHKVSATLIGFNGLPTFLNRDVMEVALLNSSNESVLKRICQELKTKYQLVEDRVGLVTPRVICMIINEAYYTVQEGTATRDDIDRAMKLGTNYPYGPFEWCERIGIKHVYELLEAVYDDTHDERYKACPLLKREYLQLQG
jgi:3-hydroxybutyryl-CoA dehydrogenase